MSEIGDASTDISANEIAGRAKFTHWLNKRTICQRKERGKMIISPVDFNNTDELWEYACVLQLRICAEGLPLRRIDHIMREILEDEAWVKKQTLKKAGRYPKEVRRDQIMAKYGMFLVFSTLFFNRHFIASVDVVTAMLSSLGTFEAGSITDQFTRFLELVPGVFYVKNINNTYYIVKGPRFVDYTDRLMREAELVISRGLIDGYSNITISNPSLLKPVVENKEELLAEVRDILHPKESPKKSLVLPPRQKPNIASKVRELQNEYLTNYTAMEELRKRRNFYYDEQEELSKKRKIQDDTEEKVKEQQEEEDKRLYLKKVSEYGFGKIFYSSGQSLEERLKKRRRQAKKGNATPVELSEHVWLYFAHGWDIVKLHAFQRISKEELLELMRKGLAQFRPHTMARKSLVDAMQALEDIRSVYKFPDLYFNRNMEL